MDPQTPVRLSVKGTIRHTNTDWPGITPGDPVRGATVGLLNWQDWTTPLASVVANARGEYELVVSTTRGECEALTLVGTLDSFGNAGYSSEQSRKLRCGSSATQRVDLKFTMHGF